MVAGELGETLLASLHMSQTDRERLKVDGLGLLPLKLLPCSAVAVQHLSLHFLHQCLLVAVCQAVGQSVGEKNSDIGSGDEADEDYDHITSASVPRVCQQDRPSPATGPLGWVKMILWTLEKVVGKRAQTAMVELQTACTGTGSVAYGLGAWL